MMKITRTKTPRLFVTAATIAVAGIALTGCSLNFVPDEAETSTSDQVPEQRTVAPSAKDAAPETEVSDDAAAPVSAMRAELLAGIEGTVSCPGGSLEITDTGRMIALGTDCATVTVSGTGTLLVAERIDTLTVSGIGNAVFATEIGTISATGQGNAVSWESGSPEVTNAGTGNELGLGLDLDY